MNNPDRLMMPDKIGFVDLVRVDGDDTWPSMAARISLGEDAERAPEDHARLTDFLIRNQHGSPLEFVSYVFRLFLPIFVLRQLSRHRISSMNEWSGRYIELPDQTWCNPDPRMQAPNVKQGSLSVPSVEGLVAHDWMESSKSEDQERIEIARESFHLGAQARHESAAEEARASYQDLLDAGVCKEQARAVLPLGTYTLVVWQVNARSLHNFLALRLDHHAQIEIQLYARAIRDLARVRTPILIDAMERDIAIQSAVRDLRNTPISRELVETDFDALRQALEMDRARRREITRKKDD